MNKFPLLYFIIPDKITQKNHSGVTVIRNSAAFLEITQSIRMHALRYVKTNRYSRTLHSVYTQYPLLIVLIKIFHKPGQGFAAFQRHGVVNGCPDTPYAAMAF